MYLIIILHYLIQYAGPKMTCGPEILYCIIWVCLHWNCQKKIPILTTLDLPLTFLRFYEKGFSMFWPNFYILRRLRLIISDRDTDIRLHNIISEKTCKENYLDSIYLIVKKYNFILEIEDVWPQEDLHLSQGGQ